MTPEEWWAARQRINALGRKVAVEAFIGCALMFACGVVGWWSQGSVATLALGCMIGGLMLGAGLTLLLVTRES